MSEVSEAPSPLRGMIARCVGGETWIRETQDGGDMASGSSLYGRLLTYRERTRTPLEDYLSEALADLLNRLSTEDLSELIATVFLKSEAAQAAWVSYLQANPSIQLGCCTQRPIEYAGHAQVHLFS